MTQETESMPNFEMEEVTLNGVLSDPAATVSNVSLETENTVIDQEPQKKKRGRSKTDSKTAEEKKAQWSQYYAQNKERKLKYKQAMRGTTKIPENKCYMSTRYLPRYIRDGKSKPKLNIDWINFNGVHRFLTISQPTDEVIALLRTQMKLQIEETVDGVYDPPSLSGTAERTARSIELTDQPKNNDAGL